jgi:membrane-associated phospholipid phosphatase
MTSNPGEPAGTALTNHGFGGRPSRSAFRRRWIAAVGTFLTIDFTATACFAEERPRAESAGEPSDTQPSMWRKEWPKFSWVEGVATVAAGVGTLALVLAGPSEEARWEGGILFDDAVRSGVRLRSAGARNSAAHLGDWPYYAAGIVPLLIDPIAVAWLGNHDPIAAANLAMTGLEAFSYSGLLSFVSTRTSSRQRPDSSECYARHPDGAGCGVDTESFWSGHTTIAATSAGLVCANHRYLPLWKYPSLDVAACVLSSAGAVVTGTSRLMADRHYLSDVLVGGAVGFGIGYAVPVLLHYSATAVPVTLSVRTAPPCEAGCLSVGGSF